MTDGGPLDSDGSENGEIVDPLGLGEFASSNIIGPSVSGENTTSQLADTGVSTLSMLILSVILIVLPGSLIATRKQFSKAKF